MDWLSRVSVILAATASMGGCSLVVDFDRSLLVDAGADAALDADVDSATDADADGSERGGPGVADTEPD
jgi:hypothetical protein